MSDYKILNVSIVVYNHSYNDIKPTLDSILPSKLLNKLFIINNSNHAFNTDVLDSNKTVFIQNKENLGFGAAHNIALKHSMQENSLYHLVLNPDVTFHSNIIEHLVSFMNSDSKIGLTMPKVLYPNGDLQYLCKLIPTPYNVFNRRFIPFKKLTNKSNHRFELRHTGYNKTIEVPSLSGCFMFLRTKTLKASGIFDDRYFMYFEDVDLSRRINEKAKTIYYPEVQIQHNFEKGSYKSLKLLKYHIISAIKYFTKWGWILDKKRKLTNKQILLALPKE